MAAILCKPLTALCDCLCTAPCKLCAGACHLCDGGLAGLYATPLAGYIVVTFATQLPLAAVAALGLSLSGLLDGCQGARWLAGMLVAALAHLVASVYVANRVANRTDAALRDRHSSWARISYLLCHDPWFALYLLVVGFFVAWLVVGSTWSLAGSLDASADCDPDLDDRVALALGLGWCYFFVAPTVLTCTMCCVCCDGTDYAANEAEFAAKTAEEEARKQQKQAEEEARKQKKQAEEARRRKRQNVAADDGDVEAPAAPPPPGTFTSEGIPIGIPIPHGKNEAVVDAVVEEPLPPPVPPPAAATAAAGNSTKEPGPDTKARVY